MRASASPASPVAAPPRAPNGRPVSAHLCPSTRLRPAGLADGKKERPGATKGAKDAKSLLENQGGFVPSFVFFAAFVAGFVARMVIVVPQGRAPVTRPISFIIDRSSIPTQQCPSPGAKTMRPP